MLFIGAEFCPICATQRWPMTVALSHFGTFTNLQQTHSAVSDGDIPTLSYYGSTFTSPYLTFTPVENTTNQPTSSGYKPLQTPTPAQNALWQANSPSGETYPFIYIDGKWLLQTSQFPDTELEGHSFNQILNSVGNNNNTIGAAIDASAAVLIQKICSVTGEKPAATCAASKAAPLATPQQGEIKPRNGQRATAGSVILPSQWAESRCPASWNTGRRQRQTATLAGDWVIELLGHTAIRTGELCDHEADAVVLMGEAQRLQVPLGKAQQSTATPAYPHPRGAAPRLDNRQPRDHRHVAHRHQDLGTEGSGSLPVAAGANPTPAAFQ
jgi:Domain of unknown function (DUF929)